MKTRLLSRKDIESFFTMKMCMEAVEKAFADLATGNATLPQRTPISVPDQHGLALFMPAHIKSLGALGAKVVTVYKDNVPKHGLPTVLGTIILLDEATGFPVALMDGGYLTAMRTGAVSGVATKYMARPEATVAAVFGAGAQAFTQVLGVHEARPLAKLFVYSVDPPDARRRFAARITETIGVPVILADDPASVVAQADTVILEGKFTEVDAGNRALKFWVGFGAGKSKLTVKGRLLDATTGTELAAFENDRHAPMSLANFEEIFLDDTRNLAEDFANFLEKLY